jgi:hypothetical protein
MNSEFQKNLHLLIRKAAKQGIKHSGKRMLPFYKTILETVYELELIRIEQNEFESIRIVQQPINKLLFPLLVEDMDHNLLGIITLDLKFKARQILTNIQQQEIKLAIGIQRAELKRAEKITMK